ncbi:hypothetical protein Y032_0012g1741 [Ancylostoma ceylanicum]|uniref:Uncharacterized protein n=1 Tax=Ancylostoma ceylanicum TaxID=53326 RepID=A0A016VCM4_9BILA|nr:hypothetical protein Y032_0012g1741 [Ancylostoma ceylanicum]
MHMFIGPMTMELTQEAQQVDCSADDAPESDDIVKFPVSINTCRPRMYSVRSPIVCAGSPVAIRPYDALVEQKADFVCSATMSFIETQQLPETVSEEEMLALSRVSLRRQ